GLLTERPRVSAFSPYTTLFRSSGEAAAKPPDVLADEPLWPSLRLTATRTRAPACRALHAARRAARPPPTTRTSVSTSVVTPASPDRKSTRLNSSHGSIPYAVFC